MAATRAGAEAVQQTVLDTLAADGPISDTRKITIANERAGSDDDQQAIKGALDSLAAKGVRGRDRIPDGR